MKMTKKRAPTTLRWFKILFVFAKYFVFYKFGKHKKDILGKRLRHLCEKLGPIFIKLGQILSTRYDILKNEDCKELQKLLDEVNPLSFREIEEIMKKDFGENYAKIFKDFEKVPLASASIAQVHKAVLVDGKKVAVKIKRPNIEKYIKFDIAILKHIVSFGELFSPSLRHLNAKKIVDQLNDWILAELDYVQEVKNINKMRTFFNYSMKKTNTSIEESEKIVIPEVYEKYCSKNIITMEFIDGIPLSKIESIRDNPDYDIEKSAKICAMLNMRYWLVNRKDEFVFHADTHPANILILPHGKSALVDFGLIGILNPVEARQTADLFLAVYARNLERTITCALEIPGISYEKYANIIRADVQEYLRKAPSMTIGFWFMDFIRIFIKHRMPIPYNMVLLGKSNAVMDGLLGTLLPGKTALDIMGDELENALRKKIMQNFLETDFSRLAYAVSEEIKKSPDKIATLVEQMANDPFKVVKDFSEAMK